jgi:PGF-CTERM protein
VKMQNIVVIALLALIPTAIAQNPIDDLTGSVQEQLNTVGQQLQQKTAQHIVEGNLTQEHISQDLNATTEQLKKDALEKINPALNVTSEQLEQKAKEELKKQLDKNVPGFEYASALIGMLGTALILRRRC